MKKKFKNLEIVTIIKKIHDSAEQDKKMPESAARLPFSVQWKKRLNLKSLTELQEIILEEEQRINEEYTDDDHSYIVKDEHGREMRRVKNAYIEEFSQKRADLYNTETDVEIHIVLPEELSGVEFTDLQMDSIMFMVKEESND